MIASASFITAAKPCWKRGGGGREGGREREREGGREGKMTALAVQSFWTCRCKRYVSSGII